MKDSDIELLEVYEQFMNNIEELEFAKGKISRFERLHTQPG